MFCWLEQELYRIHTRKAQESFRVRLQNSYRYSSWKKGNRELFMDQYVFTIGTHQDQNGYRYQFQVLYGFSCSSRTGMGSVSVPSPVFIQYHFQDRYGYIIGSRTGMGSWSFPGQVCSVLVPGSVRIQFRILDMRWFNAGSEGIRSYVILEPEKVMYWWQGKL